VSDGGGKKSIGELADEQLQDLTKLEELLNDLQNGREVYDYQIREGAEAVEECQEAAVEVLERSEKYGGSV